MILFIFPDSRLPFIDALTCTVKEERIAFAVNEILLQIMNFEKPRIKY